MRGPDVGRNIDGIRACLQCYGQKVVTVQPKDGASVRMYVADGFQPPGKDFGRFQAGQEDKAVYLAHTAVFLVNGADFPADDKAALQAGCVKSPVPRMLIPFLPAHKSRCSGVSSLLVALE